MDFVHLAGNVSTSCRNWRGLSVIILLLKKSMNERKTFKRPTKSDTTRATAASGKAGARNSPDKSQEWDLKGMRGGD